MQISLESYLKGISNFSKVKFYEQGHAYFIGDKQVISVSGLIERFKEKFDTEKQLILSAPKEKMSVDDLRKKWTYQNRHAVYEGRLLHTYLEYMMHNKDVSEDTNNLEVSFDDVKESYFKMKQMAHDFYKKQVESGKLIPVATELVMGSLFLEIAGQMDQLFYNTERNALQVWDWKTNTKMRFFNEFKGKKMLHCLSHLDECEINTYSLQLKTYRKIFMHETGIPLDQDCFIVWFNEHNQKEEVIKCLDLDEEVDLMFDFKKNNPEMFVPYKYVRPQIPQFERPIPMDESMFNINNYK